MAQIKHGTIGVEIPDPFTPPPEAGKLSKADLKKLPVTPRGVGRLCHQAADAMERAGAAFSPPPGVSIASLREAGDRADGIDQFVIDIEVVQKKLKQANRIFDVEAWRQVRKVNDHIKAQVKHDPELAVIFQQVLAGFAMFASAVNATPAEEEEEEVEEEEAAAEAPKT